MGAGKVRAGEYFYERDLNQATAELDVCGIKYTVVSELRQMLTPQGPGKPWRWRTWRVYCIMEAVCV